MTVVESGKINLYELITSTTSQGANGAMYSASNTEWYVSKGTDTAILIKGNLLARQKRKNEFADLLADNKTVYDKYMTEDKFSFDQIRYIVRLYNIGELNKELEPVNRFAKDYVITHTNDTILCKIKADTSSGSYLYEAKGANDYNKIDSTYVNEFFLSFDKIKFKLKALPGQNNREFVKCIEKGRINLFELTRSIGEQDKPILKYYWYVNKGAGSLIAIKIDANYNYDIRSHKELLAAFRNIISDNKDILSNFNYDLQYVNTNTDAIIRSYISNYNKEYSENQTGK
jgi:hypothetical protein